MAGRQVEQTTTSAKKLRRITGDNWSIERSSSTLVQGNPEPMETEPAIAPGRRSTIAVVGPTSLLPSPDNPISSFDNVQREPGVSGRQELPVQNPVIQAATVSYLDTISYFDQAHYDALLEGVDSKEYPLEILEAATRLLETCKSRKISVKPTLFSMLRFHGIDQHNSDLKTFYEKCNVFFTALNTDVTGDTASLTSMLNKSDTTNIKRVSNSFISKADDEIQYIAQSPFLKNISSMCSGKGLPEKTKVEAFLKLPCLKEDWQEGNDDAVKDKPLDRALVTNISSMCNGKGLPEKTKVEAFLKLPCLKEGWQESNDDAIENKPLDRALVTNISSMCHSKGLPEKTRVAAFLKLPCLKEDWQEGNDDSVKDKPLDRALVTNISSIFSSKGLPEKTKVEAFLKLPCLKEGWQEGNDDSVKDKPLDRALVTNISSIFSSKGLPEKTKVEAFLKLPCLKEGWQEGNDDSVKDKPLDRALVTNISSMCSTRGLPEKTKVETFLKLPCLKEGWQEGNDNAVKNKPLDRALVTNISSMCSRRGLPEKTKVEAFLKLPCLKEGWQEGNNDAVKDKPFDRALVTNISSMCSGKGLPENTKVEAFLKLHCLKKDWQEGNDDAIKDKLLDRALVTNISSMCSRRGLPEKTKVEAFLKLPCLKEGWQEGNDDAVKDKSLDRALVTHISSMCSGKGLPEKTKVEAFLKLPCLKRGWQEGNDDAVKDKPLDRALVTNISSMCNGKGLPEKTKVEAFLKLPCLKEGWQEGNDDAVKDKPLDRALVTNISSMCHSKGLPKKTKVEAFLKLPCLRKGWQEGNDNAVKDKPLDRALVTNISSMCDGKGLPEKTKVEAFLKLPCLKEGWQEGNDDAVKDKPLDRALVTSISPMCSRKGLPEKTKVETFIQWLPSDEKKNILKLSCRIFAGSGLPSGEKLTENEKMLRQNLEQPSYFVDIGGDSIDEEDEISESCQVKALALFFSAPAKWNMTIPEFQQYLADYKSPRNDRVGVYAALTSLLPILAIHGGSGARFWNEMHSKNPRNKKPLTKALSIPAPLAVTKLALTELPVSEWQEYLELCRNLKPAPTRTQWNALKPLRQQLGERFDYTRSKRIMLEILWPQSGDNRLKYADKMDDLFKTLPTISQWHELHRVFGSHKIQLFMDACLDYQAKPETAPDVATQQRLLEGMLLTKHYLLEHNDIPNLCFSNRNLASTGNKRGVIVDGDPAMTGQERLWRFITAMLFELEQTEYQFRNQRLTVLPADGEPVVLSKPEFTVKGTGFVINNWTVEQLTAFFKATEFTEQWYEKPQEKRDPCTIRLEAKLAQMKARPKETRKGEPEITVSLLPPSLIITSIKLKKPLKPAVWSSLEHYASNGQLTDRLCTALSPVIKADKDGVVPDLVKNAVAAKLGQTTASITPTLWSQVSNSSIQEPLSTFDAAMEALDRFPVLGHAELEQLEPWRGVMVTTQLMSVLEKINHHDVDKQTQSAWRIALECRKKDPLGLNEIWEVDLDSLATGSEQGNNQDWLEELLQ